MARLAYKVRPLRGRAVTLKGQQARKNLTPEGADKAAETLNSSFLTVVSRRHFFFVAPDWRHVTGTMMAALGGLRGFVGERR